MGVRGYTEVNKGTAMATKCSSTPTLILVLLAVVDALSMTGAMGQEPQGSSERSVFFDEVDVRVVNLEVFVTDKKGFPVTDLGRDDFKVLVDGRVVELTNFHLVLAPEIPGHVEAGATGEQADGLVKPQPQEVKAPAYEADERVYFAIYVDNLTLRPNTRKEVLDRLAEFVENELYPDDMVMIASAGSELEIRQPLTRDRELLVQTLMEIQGDVAYGLMEDSCLQSAIRESGGPPMDAFGQEGRATRAEAKMAGCVEQSANLAQHSMVLLDHFVRTLASFGGRKVVFHVSDGMSIDSQDLAVTTAMAHANAQGITFHTIDAGGSRQFNPRMASISGREGNFWNPQEAQHRTEMRQRVVRDLASHTGGELLLNNKTLDPALTTLRQDIGTYYSLGFAPPGERTDENHRIKVRVKGRGLKLRYPTSFREKSRDDHLREHVLSALLLRETTNPLSATMALRKATRRDNGTIEATLSVNVPMDRLNLLPHEGSFQGALTIQFVVQDTGFGTSDVQIGRLPVTLPTDNPEELAGQQVGYQAQLVLSPGSSRIAVAVRDDVSQEIATLDLDFALTPP
jgi:VWFA-related protein